MANSAFPFETQDTSETQYSYILRELQEPGVIGTPGDTNLKVIPGTGLQVKVQAGRGLARGVMIHATDDENPLTIGTPSAATRVDRIVVRINPATDSAVFAVLPGTSGSATPAALTQTDTGVFEYPLAKVTVAPGAASISASNIVDERPRLSARVGQWTTDTRAATAPLGTFGYNHTTAVFESYTATGWKDLVPTWTTLAGKPTTSTLDGRTFYAGDTAPAAGLGADGDVFLEW